MAKTDSPLISVVVPVYNVEKYIDECLESITQQSYRNLEIILVDDKSLDQSGKKCDAWSKKDNRIKVIHKAKNEGLFRARITGLESMHGDYFTLVDSDDYLANDFVSKMLEVGLTNAADIVIENTFMQVGEHGTVGKVVEMPSLHTTEDVFDGFMKNLSKENWGWCVWAKLYKSSVYYKSQKVLIPINRRINAAEDILFSTVFASHAKNTAYIEGYTGYFYRQNDASITRLLSKEASIDRLISIFNALFEVKTYLESLKLPKKYETRFYKHKEHLLSNYVWSLHNDYAKAVSKLQIQNDELTNENKNLKASKLELLGRLNALENSKSYRVGRSFSKPYVMIKRMLK